MLLGDRRCVANDITVEAGQTLVISVCSGNRAADKQPLQARKGSDGHATPKCLRG